ncbi:hypothetical protein NDU88_004903 [Pleurodeles waltl]|uniref:Uncharacterized protein n=1 Tax=Pleurodeles waltl TaxID=8319 RepID=A0AAV7MUU1_PLEWA|nr:hypothetical protein NDU88_004903 [Pleurodeles waltl]
MPAAPCTDRQLLQAARTHGPFRLDDLEVRLTADFSKETSERRRVFLDLPPSLRQLDMKYGLFETARMWITKNGVSKDFYDTEDLRVFLDGLQHQTQSMDTASRCGLRTRWGRSRVSPTTDSHPRGRDLERLTKSYDDRGQVLQAVAMHTQIADRDNLDILIDMACITPPTHTPPSLPPIQSTVRCCSDPRRVLSCCSHPVRAPWWGDWERGTVVSRERRLPGPGARRAYDWAPEA